MTLSKNIQNEINDSHLCDQIELVFARREGAGNFGWMLRHKYSQRKIDDTAIANILPVLKKLTIPIKYKNVSDGTIHVNISDSLITNKSLALLGEVYGIGKLDVSGTAVTNEGIVELNKITSILHLNISRTNVTNEIVPQVIRQFPNLKLLVVDKWYSSDMLSEFRLQYPHIIISQIPSKARVDAATQL